MDVDTRRAGIRIFRLGSPLAKDGQRPHRAGARAEGGPATRQVLEKLGSGSLKILMRPQIHPRFAAGEGPPLLRRGQRDQCSLRTAGGRGWAIS